MRRRLQAFIPIVLLAVLVQLVAPIAALRVVADAVSDPLHFASICSGMTSSDGDSQTAPAKTKNHSPTCCAVCAAGQAGTPVIDPPPLVFVARQREYQLISWLEAADPMAAVRIGSNAQARAPPSIS